MSGNYHIFGTEDFGYSTVNRYLYSFYIYMNTVKRVTGLYRDASIFDLKGYVAHFCYLRLKAFDTLLKVVVEHKDYISANCILRMLGDSVAVFYLIYMEPDKDFCWLRHALYIIDGCEENLKVLSDGEMNKGTMPDDEFQEYLKGLSYNIDLRKQLMNEAQEIIDASPLAKIDKEAFDRIVKERNWKFKDFKNYKRKGDNQYKWAELYKKIGRSEGGDNLSFISQYAHSLSMSNLVMNMNQHNRDGVLADALALINRLNEYTIQFFSNEFLYIMNGLCIPKMRDKILNCYDNEHRPSNEQWDEMVRSSVNRVYQNSYGRVEGI